LRPASRATLTIGAIVGSAMWIVALLVAAFVVDRTNAIGVGLLVTLGSFTVAALALGALRWARDREERRYASRT
jgi:hypothetical protein